MKAIKIQHNSVSIIEIDHAPEDLKKEIGGEIEQVTMRGGAAVIYDKDGISKKLLHNDLASYISCRHIYGDALIIGFELDRYCDVPEWYYVWLGS